MVKICQSFVALRCINFVLLTAILMRSISFKKEIFLSFELLYNVYLIVLVILYW
jgi:hypothetical protein